jgi:hypothetical protein
LGVKYAVDDYPIFVRAASSSSLMSPFRYVHNTFGFRSPFYTSSSYHELLTTVRGGDENAGEIKNETPQETLYLPGLLKTKVIPRTKESPTAASDSSILISKAKARELKVESGDVVGIIGRRRRVSYGVVHVSKSANKDECTISKTLASNIRIHDGDTVKVVTLGQEDLADAYGIGDMQLLAIPSKRPKRVLSVTLAPLSDSLNALEQAETNGDSIPDEEIELRFLKPYFESLGIVKLGHILVMVDENGKKLEFQVTNVELEGGDDEVEKKREEKSKMKENEDTSDGSFIVTPFFPFVLEILQSYECAELFF